ncbi:aminopeptidase P family protein [Sphingomonas sp. RS2018]
MTDHSARLASLRAELARSGLDGFVVPLTDEHMSEYVGSYARRLEWLTGFQGSAGSAAVLADRAGIFTDGRYTLQVRQQVSGDDYAYVDVPATTIEDWLSANAAAGARIGYDPWLHTRAWVEDTRAKLDAIDATLVAVPANPVDAVWHDRPQPSLATLAVQPDEVTGRASAAKRADIADWLGGQGADATVIAALDSIAWTFNVRGTDVAHTPVGLAFALVHADGTADLFVAPEKMSDAVAQHLGNAVRVHDRTDFADALRTLSGKRVAVDPERSVAAIFAALEEGGAAIVATRDPTVLPRAIKNAAEMTGHRAAQLRDGAVMARFLRWVAGEAPKGGLTEIAASDHLESLRRAAGAVDLSFDTISATGAHGASPHYKADAASNATITPGELYLIDSGGQWPDGTTDITRVLPIGPPTPEMRDRFTRVLKGHIAIATAIFPDGTAGGQIDSFARRPLWEAGLDFAHGVGHGVGAYLSVHEGPQRIAKFNYGGSGPAEPLRAGMLLSNEPGYYKAGEYGIRIENLVLVVPRAIPGGTEPMLGFETLTFTPIERDLIDATLLTPNEIGWLNAYHAEVVEKIGPALDGEDRTWLIGKCAPIA